MIRHDREWRVITKYGDGRGIFLTRKGAVEYARERDMGACDHAPHRVQVRPTPEPWEDVPQETDFYVLVPGCLGHFRAYTAGPFRLRADAEEYAARANTESSETGPHVVMARTPHGWEKS